MLQDPLKGQGRFDICCSRSCCLDELFKHLKSVIIECVLLTDLRSCLFHLNFKSLMVVKEMGLVDLML